ncbi:MAG: hypothetical protein Q4B28_04005 [bacterium]|nr:hypothetical protein [bacterium]
MSYYDPILDDAPCGDEVLGYESLVFYDQAHQTADEHSLSDEGEQDVPADAEVSTSDGN